MAHWVAPASAHGFEGVQDAPWVQAVQTLDGEQTWFAPQLAPAGTNDVGVQTSTPVPQVMAAVAAQGSGEAQAAPALQAAQVPALQTWFAPQLVPFGSAAPATQTGPPDAQEIALSLIHI